MQKRKLISLAALIALCFVMTACGTKKTQETPEPSAQISVDQQTGSVTAVLHSGEVSKLDEIENLKEADLRGSECFEEIYEWSKAHPTVAVFYDVTLPDGTVVENRTSSLDLSSLGSAQVDEAISAMKCLPKLVKVELGAQRADLGISDVKKLQDALPNVRFNYAFTVYGQSVTTNDTQLNLYHVPVEDECAAAYEAMSIMPKLEYVDMDSCGASNEAIAALRDAFPDVKVVWRVWFGNNYSVRTDVEKILASKPSVGGMLYEGNCESLMYCTECKYLDIGHNEDLGTIDFVAYMPKLEVAVLAMASWTDCSPLANCKNLEYLEIQTNPLSDLTPLSGLTKLRHLNICNTSVMDITPLYSLTGLERLWIGGWTGVPYEQIEEIQSLMPNCEVNWQAGDPTEGRWRIVGYHEEAYMYVYHPRYTLLIQQFGYTDKDYAFYWNDPLYAE